MTLLLAVIGDEFGLLGADRLTTVDPGDGRPQYQEENDKLFDVGGCAVGAYGDSPVGFSVPAFIRQSANQRWRAADLAAELSRRRAALSDQGAFGLFLLGSGATRLEVWENPKDGRLPVQLGERTLHLSNRTLHLHYAVPLALSDAAQLRDQLLNLFGQASNNAALGVGPPYEIAEVRVGGNLQITRFQS